MNSLYLLLPILLPVAAGFVSLFLRFRSRHTMEAFHLIPVCITSVLVWVLILQPPEGAFVLLRFASELTISLHLDAFGSFFAGIVATNQIKKWMIY